MLYRIALAALLLVLVGAPAFADDVLYDGSTDLATFGWKTWEGVIQGAVEGGVYHLNDSSSLKTKLKFGNSGVTVDSNTGVYIESRMKCVSSSNPDSTPLNLGLWISDIGVRRELSVQPSKIIMNNASYSPGANYFTDYHTIRQVYKRLDLRTRGARQHSWAVYVDGNDVPVLWTSESSGAPTFGGPTWGAGNTGDSQDLYFDYVNYYDDGAFAPGMDGSVSFVNGDPDGRCSPSGTSFTISWETNVATGGTLYYKRVSDSTYLSVGDPNPGLHTTHSATVNGTAAGDVYHYYVVSVDAGGKKVVSLPSELVLNPFYISSGPTANVTDANTVTINWETSLPDASSEVHYGLYPGVVETVIASTAGVTSHSVTLPGIEPGKLYYFYVRSTSAQWPPVASGVPDDPNKQQVFTTSIPGDEYLDNVGFEVPDTSANQAKTAANRDSQPWVPFGFRTPIGGIYRMFELGGWTPKLAYCAGSVDHYSNAHNMAGYYQTIPTTAGSFYEAKVYVWTRRQAGTAAEPTADPSKPLDVACRIGIDPTGGTEAGHLDEFGVWHENPNISWSAWHETINACTDNDSGGNGGPWEQISAGIKAQGPSATVFLQQQHKWPLVWNISGFDDASWGPMGPPPSTLRETLAIPDGYPCELSGQVVVGVYQDPDDFSGFFFVEAPDHATAIKVMSDATVNPGDLVTISGKMETANGRRQIRAYSVVAAPGGTVPAALGLNGKATTAAVKPMAMPVTMWGRVTSADFDYFYVDDGSGVEDGTVNGVLQPSKGIRVMIPYFSPVYPPAEGDYVTVKGVLDTYTATTLQGDPLVQVDVVVPVIWADEAKIQ